MIQIKHMNGRQIIDQDDDVHELKKGCEIVLDGKKASIGQLEPGMHVHLNAKSGGLLTKITVTSLSRADKAEFEKARAEEQKELKDAAS